MTFYIIHCQWYDTRQQCIKDDNKLLFISPACHYWSALLKNRPMPPCNWLQLTITTSGRPVRQPSAELNLHRYVLLKALTNNVGRESFTFLFRAGCDNRSNLHLEAIIYLFRNLIDKETWRRCRWVNGINTPRRRKFVLCNNHNKQNRANSK